VQPSWDPSGTLGVSEPGGWRSRPPAPQVVPIPNPAKGANLSWQAPETHLLRLQSAYAQLRTGTTAQAVNLQVLSPTGTRLVRTNNGTKSTQSATSTRRYSWFIGGALQDWFADLMQGLPDVLFPPGCTVQIIAESSTSTSPLIQWSDAVLLVQLI
jgi:hypothetical protein